MIFTSFCDHTYMLLTEYHVDWIVNTLSSNYVFTCCSVTLNYEKRLTRLYKLRYTQKDLTANFP